MRLPAFLHKQVELCLYDFLHPGEVPPNEARLEADHRMFESGSPDRELIAEVQGHPLTAERFRRGEKCFAALHRGRVVSYIWSSRGIVGVEEIGMAVQSAASEAYLYDAFTLEPWRGNNLYPAVLRRALEDGGREGLSRSLIFVEAGNTASRRGVAKAGFLQFQTLLFHRVLGVGFKSLQPPLDGHPPAKFVRIF